MPDEESVNTHPDDGAAPAPAPPEDDPPPEPEENVAMSVDEDALKESDTRHAHEDDTDQPTIDDGYIQVTRNGRVRRERRDKADENTIIGLAPPTVPTRLSNVPPPPMQLYNDDTTTVLQQEKGVIVTYSKIKFSQRFATKTSDVLPGKTFQSLIGSLQKADPTLMICPLAPTRDTSSNYIDQTCHIPVASETLLRNYFTHTVLRNSVHGVFLIRTKHTLTTLKENASVMDFLRTNNISLSQTNWLTERKKDVFFLYGANEAITRRDDLKTAIRENMDTEEPFGLYPKRDTIYINGKRTVFRALFIDSKEDRTEEITNQVSKAFESNDPRLQGFTLVPAKPTPDMDLAEIELNASMHNGLMTTMTHHTIRGIEEIDMKMETKSGENMSLREYFATVLINTSPDTKANLFLRTERGPDNKVFLIHNKKHSGIVNNFISQLKGQLEGKFSPEELAKSQGPDLTPQRKLTTFSNTATKRNAEYLRNLHGTPQPRATRPPTRNNRPITASYPQDYPKLPTGKSNTWDDRRARQNKITPNRGGGWTQPPVIPQRINNPVYQMPNYQVQTFQNAQESNSINPNSIANPAEPPLTEISSLTEVDRQLLQMRKEIADMGKEVIKNRKDMLDAVKKEIETNQAQHKALIESTINTTMTAFFTRQEETNKQNELARQADKKESIRQHLAQQHAYTEEKKQRNLENKSRMDLETQQRDTQMNTMFNGFLAQMKTEIQQTMTHSPPTVTPTKTKEMKGTKQKGKRLNSPGSPQRIAPPLRSQEIDSEMDLVPLNNSGEVEPTGKREQKENQIRENPLNKTPPTTSVDEEMA